jgi:hypothetical protein
VKFQIRPKCKNKHIESSLVGGFGNQLFQFSTAITESIKNEALLSFNFLDKNRNYSLDIIHVDLNKIYKPTISSNNELILQVVGNKTDCTFVNFEEKKFTYEKIGELKDHARLTGYFQSPYYFQDFDQQIKSYLKKALKIVSRDENFVHIHARFGDMAKNPEIRRVHGVITDDYLERALKHFNLESNELRLVVQDIDMLKNELPRFCEKTYKVISNDFLSDFQTLAAAKNLIISNSTFSWWAAYLSSAKVVAPAKWFAEEFLINNPIDDLIPESWILE